MYQRDHNRSQTPSHRASPRRSAHPVLALQRLIGNRGTTRVLARDKRGGKQGTFENSVKVGKLGPIEVKESNAADWLGKKNPENLTVTTTKGKKTSDELKRLSESRERVDTIEIQVITGENSWVKITFSNARIKGYAADDGKTESWTATDFDNVHIDRLSIGTPRP